MVQVRFEAAAASGALSPRELPAALWALSQSPCPSTAVSMDVLADHAVAELAVMSTSSVAEVARVVSVAELHPGAHLYLRRARCSCFTCSIASEPVSQTACSCFQAPKSVGVGGSPAPQQSIEYTCCGVRGTATVCRLTACTHTGGFFATVARTITLRMEYTHTADLLLVASILHRRAQHTSPESSSGSLLASMLHVVDHRLAAMQVTDLAETLHMLATVRSCTLEQICYACTSQSRRCVMQGSQLQMFCLTRCLHQGSPGWADVVSETGSPACSIKWTWLSWLRSSWLLCGAARRTSATPGHRAQLGHSLRSVYPQAIAGQAVQRL